MTLEEHIIKCLPHLIGECRVVKTNSIGDLYVCDGVIYYRIYDSYGLHLSKDFLWLFKTVFSVDPTEKLIRIVFEGALNLSIIYYEDEIGSYDKMLKVVNKYEN
jgi:hypothetical protein